LFTLGLGRATRAVSSPLDPLTELGIVLVAPFPKRSL
jgi:hypothetical protein